MNIVNFILSLSLCIFIVAGALRYLRPIAISVLHELCPSPAGAEFWLRCAELMALAGSLTPVVVLANMQTGLGLVRATIAYSMLGLFISVLCISNGVWRTVQQQLRAASISPPSPASLAAQ